MGIYQFHNVNTLKKILSFIFIIKPKNDYLLEER